MRASQWADGAQPAAHGLSTELVHMARMQRASSTAPTCHFEMISCAVRIQHGHVMDTNWLSQYAFGIQNGYKKMRMNAWRIEWTYHSHNNDTL